MGPGMETAAPVDASLHFSKISGSKMDRAGGETSAGGSSNSLVCFGDKPLFDWTARKAATRDDSVATG